MKNSIHQTLLTLLLTLFVGTLQGQNNSNLAEIQQDGNVEYTLIRPYDGKMLYYVRTTDENYFALNDVGAISASRAYIPMDYEISDMKILGDTLYFCGYDNSQSKGVIGLFHIPSFVSSNNRYIIHTDFRIPDLYMSYVEDINRLCVYLRPTTHRPYIVAVGNRNARNCIIAIPDASANSATWSYKIGMSDNPNEKFTDITVTEDYVVTSGYLNSNNHIALRAHNKNSIFSSSFGNVVYPFYSYGMGDWIYYGYDDVRLTALEQNHVATYSTMRIEDTTHTPLTRRDGLLLNIYDITAMIGSSSYSPAYSTAMVNLDTTTHARVHALSYDDSTSKILGLAHYMGLTPNMTAAENSWITEMNMNPIATNFLTRYCHLHWFEDAVVDVANGRYFAIGHHASMPQKLVLMSNDYFSVGCKAKTPISHNNGYQLAAKEETVTFSTYTSTTSRTQAEPIAVNQMQIDYDCIITE